MRVKLVEVFFIRPEFSEEEGFEIEPCKEHVEKPYEVTKSFEAVKEKYKGGYTLETIEKNFALRKEASEILGIPSSEFSVSTYNAAMNAWPIVRKKSFCIITSSNKRGPIEAAVISCENLFRKNCKSAYLTSGSEPMTPKRGSKKWPVMARFTIQW
jgi:hypothetical protein